MVIRLLFVDDTSRGLVVAEKSPIWDWSSSWLMAKNPNWIYRIFWFLINQVILPVRFVG